MTAALGYTVVTLAAQAVWGTETWQRRGEAFSVYFNLFSRISPFETRDRVVGVRPPLAGLPKLDAAPGTVAFVTAMIGTVTFDGLSQGRCGRTSRRTSSTRSRRSGRACRRRRSSPTRSACSSAWALVAGFYWLGMEGARSVGGDIPGPTGCG